MATLSTVEAWRVLLRLLSHGPTLVQRKLRLGPHRELVPGALQAQLAAVLCGVERSALLSLHVLACRRNFRILDVVAGLMHGRHNVGLNEFFHIDLVVTALGYERRVAEVESTEPLRVGVLPFGRFLLDLLLVLVLLFLGILLVPGLSGKVGAVTVTFTTALLATTLGT